MSENRNSTDSIYDNSNYLSFFNKVSEIKAVYKGVNLTPFIFQILYSIEILLSKETIKDHLKILIVGLDENKIKEIFENDPIVFTTIYNGRNDYKELITKMHCALGEGSIIELNPLRLYLNFNIKKIAYIIYKTFFSENIRYFSFRTKLILSFNLIFAIKQIDKLEKVYTNSKVVVEHFIPFNSTVRFECLLTEFMNAKGVNTYHYFHGYMSLSPQKPSIDWINAINLTSKKIWAFSENLKKDLVTFFKVNQDRIAVVGNPKYPMKNISIRNTFKKCIVFTGYTVYDDYNYKLLLELNEFAKNSDIQFDIKPHPNSNISNKFSNGHFPNLNLVDKSLTIAGLLKVSDYDFAISYNTTAYYEAMYHSLICFRYDKDDVLKLQGLDDYFSNKEQLKGKIHFYMTMDMNLLNTQVEDILRLGLGMGINQIKIN